MQLAERYICTPVRLEDAETVSVIEQICFPPNEACTPEIMHQRVKTITDAFMTVRLCSTDEPVGFINGLVSDEEDFRDDFFLHTELHDPSGSHVMIMGLDILPEHRGQGLASFLMKAFAADQKSRGRTRLVLTCLEDRTEMYRHMGFTDHGIADSTWGGEVWHLMDMDL